MNRFPHEFIIFIAVIIQLLVHKVARMQVFLTPLNSARHWLLPLSELQITITLLYINDYLLVLEIR